MLSAPVAWAQSSLAVVEVVASNESNIDSFGETSDWIELQNFGPPVDTTGWTIADDGDVWFLPGALVGTGERVIVRASGRDVVAGAEWHSNFRLSASGGETVTLADATGTAVSSLTFPPLGSDQSFGRAVTGDIGFLDEVTFNAVNSGLAPAVVTVVTPAQAFTGSLDVVLATAGGSTIRYTTDGSPVTGSSAEYGGALTFAESTVLRAAVVDGDAVGPEASAAYVAITAALSSQTSDLPMVFINKTTSTDFVRDGELLPTVMSIVEPGADGRTDPLGEVDYLGFAGMRIRGNSSAAFPKKQYKVELWSDPAGTEVRRDLLGLGADGDWGLYAPGHRDRAMINNPLAYELGHQIGVAAPDSRFVEVYLETSPGSPIDASSYQGLYLLRETIEVAENRVDITSHTESTPGGAGGYIIKYDWEDDCCYSFKPLGDTLDRFIAISDPGAEATDDQKAWITSRWTAIQDASAALDFAASDALVDFDSVIDHWIIEMVVKDADALRASHFTHLDAGGKLMGGPLWDFDRSMGAADRRVENISDAEGWGGPDEAYLTGSDIYAGFWLMPEVQARVRARWAQLRAGVLSDSALVALIDEMGAEITEAYSREIIVWGSDGYGSRFDGGLDGELSHLKLWLTTRTAWLDSQLIATTNPPTVDVPATVVVDENDSVALQITTTGTAPLFFDITGLPQGLSMDDNGSITGTVAYGDAGTFPVRLTVTDALGAGTTVNFSIVVTPLFSGVPKVLLNEFNSVEPGRLLDNDGTDLGFGSIGGNAGDWFELVTLEDNLDMRGWSFELWSNVDGEMTQNAVLELGDDPALVGIRAGSIVTVAESIVDSLTYNPRADDWTMNWQANSAQAGSLFVSQVDFDTNNNKWRLIIRDADNNPVAPVAGETEPWDDANGGVSGREVFALNADPTIAVDPVVDYIDTTTSTFGLPNLVVPVGEINGTPQNLAALRPALTPDGDVNCDGEMNIVDAYDVALFSVALIGDSGRCPLQGADVIHAAAGDLTQDGATNVLDASVIARCVVGLPDPVCP